VPEISRFYGIVIRMYYDDHNPPHFHAEYGSGNIIIEIETLSILAGALAPRALGLVIEWGTLHRAELLSAWESAGRFEAINRIAPLA
jgi:hypothetical protein